MVYGFILTMWYVNNGLKIWLQQNTTSFILTMWYVNLGTVVKQTPYIVFYINYVVCKSNLLLYA